MPTWLLLAAASAAPADKGEAIRAPRDIKIDLFSFDPRAHIWGSDWKVTALEQWTAVLKCVPTTPSVERCSFPDGVWWSVLLVEAPDKLTSMKLPAPGEIEWSWTPNGRLKAWDVIGDRSAFWTESSNAALKLMYHRSDKVYRQDEQRQIGQDLEGRLTRGLAGAVEWELSKTGGPAPGQTWEPTQTPWIARRWQQSSSSPKLECRATAGDGGRLLLTMEGTVKEQSAAESTVPGVVTTTVLGTAVWDPAVRSVVETTFETSAVASGNWELAGHARSSAIVTPWTQGGSTEPAEMPPIRLP